MFEVMQIPTAEEMCERTNKTPNPSTTTENNEIYEAIMNTSNRGEFFAKIRLETNNGNMSQKMLDRLISLGYRVGLFGGNQYVQPFYGISWAKAKE